MINPIFSLSKEIRQTIEKTFQIRGITLNLH